MANALALPTKGAAQSNSMRALDCVHINLSQSERRNLIPDAQAMALLCDPQFLPVSMKKRLDTSEDAAPQAALKCRVRTAEMPLVGVMASYGKQHTLPEIHLREKGLHTTLLDDGKGVRFFSPWEFAAAMGCEPKLAIPKDMTSAWRFTGNMISVHHALLQVYRTHLLLGELSPVSPLCLLSECVSQLSKQRVHLSGVRVVLEEDLHVLQAIPSSCEDTPKHNPGGKRPRPSVAPTHPTKKRQGHPAVPVDRVTHDAQPASSTAHNDQHTEQKADILLPCMVAGDVSETSGEPTTPGSEVCEGRCSQMHVGFSSVPEWAGGGDQMVCGPSKGPSDPDRCRLLQETTWVFKPGYALAQESRDNPCIHEGTALTHRPISMPQGFWPVNVANPRLEEIWDVPPEETVRAVPLRVTTDEGSWGFAGWTEHGLTASCIAKSALPHLQAEHLRSFVINGQQAVLSSVPATMTSFCVVLGMRKFRRTISTEFQKMPIQVDVDATWTFQDLKAFVCAHLKVLPQCFWIDAKEGCPSPAAFVLSLPDTDFMLIPHPIVGAFPKPMVACDIAASLQVPPFHSDVGMKATESHVRLAIRHPVWATVRTICRRQDALLADLIAPLLPDMVARCQITVAIKGCEPAGAMTLGQAVKVGGVQIILSSPKLYPPIDVACELRRQSIHHAMGQVPFCRASQRNPGAS